MLLENIPRYKASQKWWENAGFAPINPGGKKNWEGLEISLNLRDLNLGKDPPE